MSARSLEEETRSWKSYIWYVRLPRPVLHISLKLGEGIHGTSRRKRGGFSSSSMHAFSHTQRYHTSANEYPVLLSRCWLLKLIGCQLHVSRPAEHHCELSIVYLRLISDGSSCCRRTHMCPACKKSESRLLSEFLPLADTPAALDCRNGLLRLLSLSHS